MMTTRRNAEIVREYTPLDERSIHGVTFDGNLVWFARNDELVAFDPKTEKVVHRHEVPKAGAGTAFDGENIFQLAGDEILVVRPADGRVLRRLPAPLKGGSMSGMAWSDGHLWIGQYSESKIHKVDAKTGAIVKTITSDRFVTGVSCVDDTLWHAVSDDGPCELRKLAKDGTVEESLTVPVKHIAGMERTRADEFWCAGEKGKLRLVRPTRAS